MLDHQTLYLELQAQLEYCHTSDLTLPMQIQQCFAYAYQALNRWDNLCKIKNDGKQECIYNLKHIRPLFLKEVYYYELVYFATLFVPEEKSKALQFWRRECLRLERFQQQYPEFCRYYGSERIDEDETYFTYMGTAQFHLEQSHEYREDLMRGDYFAGQLLALERYSIYVKLQVTRLLIEAP
jgi:hypothetical protein